MIVTEEQKSEAQAFYQEGITLLQESGVDFMLGGGFATFHYTGMFRDTKDLDIFCLPSEYPKILKYFSQKGYETPAGGDGRQRVLELLERADEVLLEGKAGVVGSDRDAHSVGL